MRSVGFAWGKPMKNKQKQITIHIYRRAIVRAVPSGCIYNVFDDGKVKLLYQQRHNKPLRSVQSVGVLITFNRDL